MHLDPLPLKLLVTFSAVLSSAAIADTTLTYTDSGFGPAERKTVIHIHGDKVRMEESGSGIYSLYDDGKKELFTVNTQTKQYIETNPDKIRERMAKVVEMQNQFKEEMKKQVAQMPEDQRKTVEARMQQIEEMKKAPPPKMEIEKTDRKDTIQGMECTISTIKIDGQPAREICIANSDAIDANDQKMLVSMFEYMDNIAAESAKAQGMSPPPDGSSTVHKDGLALRIQALPQGPRSELSAISKDALNDADFTVPSDYSVFEPSDAPPPAAAGSAPAPATGGAPAPAGATPTPATAPAAPATPPAAAPAAQ